MTDRQADREASVWTDSLWPASLPNSHTPPVPGKGLSREKAQLVST